MNKNISFFKKYNLIIITILLALINANSHAEQGDYANDNQNGSKFILEKRNLKDLKIGATLKTTDGPIPIGNVIDRLVNVANSRLNGEKINRVIWKKGANPQDAVDVSISSDDDYDHAFNNLLGRIDCEYEISNNDMIIKNIK